MIETKYTYPDYILDEADDTELMRVARGLVALEYGRYALGPVKQGESVLILVPNYQDKRVLNAIKTALKEKGAGDIDVAYENEILGWKTLPNFSSDRSWDELHFFPAWFGYNEFLKESDAPKEMRENNYAFLNTIKRYVDSQPKKYDVIVAGLGGWTHYKKILGDPYKSLWPYTNYEYLRLFADYPAEVWHAVEDRIRSIMPLVEEVHVTDEEGTDLRFSMNEEEARLWREESQPSNHLFMYPRPPSFPESNGVIAGTSNHFGFFPHVKVHMKHGLIEKIEGGGKFGDIWRDYLERYRNFSYPDFPSPGYYYIHESALATNPKGFRHPKEIFNTPIFMTNDSERNRAGIIHWGFGLQALDFIERQRPCQDEYDRVMKYSKETGAPFCHSAHIHNMFLTYDVKLRDSKETVRIINKGRITFFDDPEIRKIASKYGNPDEIFRYEWVPAVPGITYEGNYFKDYANDPISWIKEEMNEIMPKKVLRIKEEKGLSVPPHQHEHSH
ncbi:MAG TPA: hypothetical protein VFF30_07035 [Nitrososphaerales archaeon]|nr:hypothetical protein [Nitrososphaerales archaeon]